MWNPLKVLVETPGWLQACVSLGSLVVAIFSVRLAIRESRSKAQQTDKYVQTLEAVIQYSKFLKHLEEYGRYLERLQGLDIKIGEAADKLVTVASRISQSVETAGPQITASLESLAKASKAAEDVARQLVQIGQVSLRAQRDSIKAHERLIAETQPQSRIQISDSSS